MNEAAAPSRDTSFFTSSVTFQRRAERIEDLTNETVMMFPKGGLPAPPKRFWWAHGTEVAYVVVDAMGLGLIIASGLLARALQARSGRREPPAIPPSS